MAWILCVLLLSKSKNIYMAFMYTHTGHTHTLLRRECSSKNVHLILLQQTFHIMETFSRILVLYYTTCVGRRPSVKTHFFLFYSFTHSHTRAVGDIMHSLQYTFRRLTIILNVCRRRRRALATDRHLVINRVFSVYRCYGINDRF